METLRLRKRVRALMIFYIVALVLSALTAIPLSWELEMTQRLAGAGTLPGRLLPGLPPWIDFLQQSISALEKDYPFIFYGADWLAFGIIVIAIAFVGPLRDPVRNIWVIELGMIACVLVIPTALLCGSIRGIPLFHRLVDCSFGVIGILPLWLSRVYVRRIEALERGAG